MRMVISLAFACAGFSLPAQTPPPNSIVISPKGAKSTPTTGMPKVILQTDPDRPGFYVIRPSGRLPDSPSGSIVLLPTPRENVPHLEIIRPKPVPVNRQPPSGTPVAKEQEEVKDGKILLETWDVATCRGLKVGYTHTVVREYERDKKKMIYGTKKLVMQVARFGQSVEIWAENSTIETLEGKVIVTRTRQVNGKDSVQSIVGTATEKGLSVKIEGVLNHAETIPWPEGVLGIGKEATLLKDKKPKVGETVEYLNYEARINRVVKMKITAQAPEEVALAEGQKAKSYLKFKLEMEPSGDFTLPPATLFADPETFEPLRIDSQMPTLGGKMTVLRTTKEVALREPTQRIDIAEVLMIKLDRAVPGIHTKSSVIYRIRFDGDTPLEKIFAADDRQKIQDADQKGQTFDLAVSAVREPIQPKVPPEKIGKEYLSNSYFIDWDNDLVKKHAAAAIRNLGAGASDWKKAQAIETWVNANMKATEFSQAMAPCFSVAKSLSGDCTEYSMLATGMARALGIPSRTALGVVYVPAKPGNKPTLAYHMWFEVWIDGQWLSLDSTLGFGSIGPGHIKITDAHWDGERGVTPLLPVFNVLSAAPKMSIGKVDGR